MKNLYFAILIMFLSFPVALQSYDWNRNNVTIVEQSVEESKTTQALKDEKGRLFGITYYNDINEETAKRVLSLKDDFYGWQSMKVGKLDFTYSEGGLQISLIPEKYESGGVDFNQYMPSGMLFAYTTLLQYDFRINVSNLFVRIKGDFTTEARFSEKIAAAIRNPQEFIKRRDPEYLLQQIEGLEDSMAKLKSAIVSVNNKGFFGGVEPIPQDTINRVVGIRAGNPQITVEQISKALEKEKVKASDREINLILNVYFNQFNK